MREPFEVKLIEQLSYQGKFEDIMKNIFADAADEMFAYLCLYQITDGRLGGIVVASDCENGVENAENVSMVWTKQNDCGEGQTGSKEILLPVFIVHRNTPDFALRGIVKETSDFNAAYERLCTIRNFTEYIANRNIYEESTKASLDIVRSVTDRMPAGAIVLDLEKDEVLTMNLVAAKSPAIQNAVGIALKEYRKSGQKKISEVYDEENESWYNVYFDIITWIDGKNVILATTLNVSLMVKNREMTKFQLNNDYLTGLFNRKKCEKDLEEAVRAARESNEKGVLLFLDLDDFKQVNDGLGHQYGDALLKAISDGLRAIPEIASKCYRIGGDEFTIIISPDIFDSITDIVDRIADMFNMPWIILGIKYFCTMSMGLSVFPDDAVEVSDIIKLADFAMYEAKKSGKNTYLWYKDCTDAKDREHRELEEMINKAVKNGCEGFSVVYQPVFDLAGKIVAAEAFLRLDDHQKGYIPPSEFIPIAEHLGVMTIAGEFALKEACQKLAHWNETIDEKFKMHINIAAVQLLMPEAYNKIVNDIDACGASHDNVILDISETMVFRDESRAIRNIEILKAYGIETALDDFGTGQMSLNRIREFETKIVKVDEKFLKDVQNNIYKQAALEAIVSMSEKLGIVLCYNGVENEEQRQYAVSHGGRLFSGFYLGKVVSAKEFERELRENADIFKSC